MAKRSRAQFDGKETSGSTLFEIDVASWTSGPFAVEIKKPEEVACFSRDADRNISYGSRSKLSAYREPRIGADLKRGIESFVEKRADDKEPSGVEPVVRALLKGGFNIEKDATFVTYRNNLNKLAATPYNSRDEWEVDATCVSDDGPTFLDVRKLDDGRGENPRQKQFMYMGYYFENLCTGAGDEVVDSNVEFCSILCLHLGSQKIAFAAEIDCEENGQYRELKTMREPRSQRDMDNLYKHRLMKYWIQSYLAGVPEVVVGMRDDSGFLRHVEKFDTVGLPRLARERLPPHQNVWNDRTILNFLDFVLAQVRNACKKNKGRAIRMRYEPTQKKIILRLLDESDFSNRMRTELNRNAKFESSLSSAQVS